MHGAAYKNLPKIVQLLAEQGAKIDVWNRKNKYGWTPLSIAEGHRPGNFKPSPDTIAALQSVMRPPVFPQISTESVSVNSKAAPSDKRRRLGRGD